MLMNDMEPSAIKGFRYNNLTIHLINDSDVSMLHDYLLQIDESEYFINELHNSYLPQYDSDAQRIKYGFYTLIDDKLVGMCLLGVSSWKHCRGYTGADTFPHMRGQNIAPLSKAPLFYLAFELLKLNRVETGCSVSNISSKRSIEKTKGFKFEGILRDYCKNADGSFEDEYRYGILKSDWFKHYNKSDIELIQ